MKTANFMILISLIVLMQSCVLQAPSNARKSSLLSNSTNTTSTNPPSTSPTFTNDESLYWFTTAKVTGTVTLNKTGQDIIYLRGKFIHDFLNSKDINGKEFYRKQFCLVGNFSSATYKQTRVRAIPLSVTSANNSTERLLRIDYPSESDNSAACKNTTIDNILPINAAYSFPGICQNCSGQITTANLNLYELKTSPVSLENSLEKILPTAFNMSSVQMRIDLQSNSSSPISECTNSSCSAKGFDCCISGQCVKDGTEKINASQDSQYNQSKLDSVTNPLAFINYPNIYYICSNIAHTPSPSLPSTSTPISNAQARVVAYLADYKCVNDVSLDLGYDQCRSLDAEGNPTISDKTETIYNATKKKLAIACGCVANEDQMAVKCPDWGIIPVYLAGAPQTYNNITDFSCYTPQPPNPIGPITNLNVTVPNRSAPHRFYSTAGTSYNDLSGLLKKFPTLSQEGKDFFYIDEYNKIGAVNDSYNINSVLGKMTVDLTHTLPAKTVEVELGKTYILSATSGFFTPCSQCAKDSWFQSFTAHPNTQRGVGLQASGYTTSRDTYSANATFGNYEDTKFGRACYVPVTMLPLSHQKNTNVQVQRTSRLKTQAAFYVNGYQRDWYGFNKGALIGSFDGVTWFAVGTGRRITATSTKLFLALNAAFLDLADRTDTIVNIIPDFAANIASDFDFDPSLTLTDPRQNTAATCQYFHQCNVDADCVAQLGWEYTCADVSQIKTKWPLFDSEAKESTNQERDSTLFEILQSTISTSNGKRCVYRGQGAPCKRDYTSLNNYDSETATALNKTLKCAPNFYCAGLSSNKFNDEIVRSPNELNDILFGMDSKVLGRPLNYVTANKTLSADIVANIKYNAISSMKFSSSDADDLGICRPGRSLSNDELLAHMSADNLKRTDYISQIGSCNSTGTGSARFITCPAFNEELNYVDPSALDTSLNRQTQNACGGEAKTYDNNVSAPLDSAFRNIEALTLLKVQNITQPTLVQDACFRRAGSVCHTDLDCGPNIMHEEEVGIAGIKFFGGTEAEQQYWKESLVCGQGTSVPAKGTAGYFDYKLSQNRCCREIGKDFTMYTQGPTSIIPENTGANASLNTTPMSNPKAQYRYSRYNISKNVLIDPSMLPKVSASSEPEKNQWQTINETGSLTCCGGGWIRKFADGTHDWKIRNRLTLDSSNFTCLNFRSPLASSTYSTFVADKVDRTSYQRDYEFFCKSPDIGGCMQIPYQPLNGYAIYSPQPYDPSQAIISDGIPSLPPSGFSRIDTSPTQDPIDGTIPWIQNVNSDAPYAPKPFYWTQFPWMDVNAQTGSAYNFFTNRDFDYGVEMYLPAYVGWDGVLGTAGSTPADPTFIKSVYIKYFTGTSASPTVVDITSSVALPGECNNVINYSSPTGFPIDEISTDETWCITSSSKTQNRPVVIVKASTDPLKKWKYAGIVIDFKPVENVKGLTVAEPGNPLYYVSRLARLELIGIPQITYEPLYCNDNQNNLVPGIFKSNLKTRGDFNALGVGKNYSVINPDPIDRYNADSSVSSIESVVGGKNYGNSEKKFTYQDKLDLPQIFSSKDFTCCTPLGKSTNSASKCCSGYATLGDDKKTSYCKLPTGTDLNVYFNKFVSNEGIGSDQPGGGFIVKTATNNPNDPEIDFNPYTGEPKYRLSTESKIIALGKVYCENGKTPSQGGAFGLFPPEPFSGSYTLQQGSTGSIESYFPFSIVDSLIDFQNSDLNRGKIPFDSGYKWNHHYYCK